MTKVYSSPRETHRSALEILRRVSDHVDRQLAADHGALRDENLLLAAEQSEDPVPFLVDDPAAVSRCDSHTAGLSSLINGTARTHMQVCGFDRHVPEGIIEQIVSLSDSTSTVVRGALQLPQMSASSVTPVPQSQTCGKAATALDAAQGTVNANRTMYVFKLGTTRYAVFEVASPSSDFGGAGENFIWYFTNKWAFLSSGLI